MRPTATTSATAALGTGLAVVRVSACCWRWRWACWPTAPAAGASSWSRRSLHCLFTAALIGLAPTFETVHRRPRPAALPGHRAQHRAVGAGGRGACRRATARVTLSLVLLANGAGLALAVGALPIAAAGSGGFAAVYVLQLLGLPLVLDAARRLRESPRYVAHAGEPHRYGELLAPALPQAVCSWSAAAALLSAIFFAPTAEFFNRYLDDVHGFCVVRDRGLPGDHRAAPSFTMLAGGRPAGGPARAQVGGRAARARGHRGVRGLLPRRRARGCGSGGVRWERCSGRPAGPLWPRTTTSCSPPACASAREHRAGAAATVDRICRGPGSSSAARGRPRGGPGDRAARTSARLLGAVIVALAVPRDRSPRARGHEPGRWSVTQSIQKHEEILT